MDQLLAWIEYLVRHPQIGFGVVAILASALYLLMRKPKGVREAEARMRKLREERADQYNRMRPPR